MYVYRDVCSITKQCASTDLNVHLQRFMYTANKVKIYRLECTLKNFMCLFNTEFIEHS